MSLLSRNKTVEFPSSLLPHTKLFLKELTSTISVVVEESAIRTDDLMVPRWVWLTTIQVGTPKGKKGEEKSFRIVIVSSLPFQIHCKLVLRGGWSIMLSYFAGGLLQICHVKFAMTG
ncbi:hypothetical protein AVEN_179467-1 [Araneus ventricosus]|uniref:Uncharacterized protein n=1 Tax=Araneus ventricosus TaxID=182803 RepID=A0A4Y2BGZ5_ARAVE|nr:hypothetical protein AVEN_179467-1 [Araneus ventricosus]